MQHFVIGAADTETPWVLALEGYPTRERAQGAINWQKKPYDENGPDYWRIVTLDELRELKPRLSQTPYTEEAFSKFMATL